MHFCIALHCNLLAAKFVLFSYFFTTTHRLLITIMSSVLNLAQKISGKCRTVPPKQINDISVSFIANLFERICLPYLKETFILPSPTTRPEECLNSIIECISCHFVNLDLSSVLCEKALIEKDESALRLLLRIFDELYDCLAGAEQNTIPEKPDSTPRKTVDTAAQSKRNIQPSLGPTYLGKPLRNLRSVSSVIYSPRTEALRRLKRAKTFTEIKAKKTIAEKIKEAAEKRQYVPHNFSRKSSGIQGHNLAKERRRKTLAVEQAKVAVRNAVKDRRRVDVLTKGALKSVVQVEISNEFRLENVKENVKNQLIRRGRILSDHPRPDFLDSGKFSASNLKNSNFKNISNLLIEAQAHVSTNNF